MSKVILDDETLAKLGGLTQSVELYDERGNRLAVVTPMDSGKFAPFTDAEIAAGRASLARGEPGITTAELLAKMRALG